MRGRVYDPVTGRFLSADPNIQSPYDTQSYNRYTYVKNNPLKYTDPSGFFSFHIGKFFKKVFKAAHKLFENFLRVMGDPGYYILHSKFVKNIFRKYQWARMIGLMVASYFGGPFGAAGFSAYLTEIQGGSFSDCMKSFAISLVSAYVANGVAEGTAKAFGISSAQAHAVSYMNMEIENAFTIATVKNVAHGITRGIITKVEGGSARGGFWSGFVASAFGSTSDNFFVGTIQTAVLGGTASVLSGGKFENGARSAAFVHMFNKLGDGIDRAIHKTKEFYKFGAKYGDATKEVIRSGTKGAVIGGMKTRNPYGALVGAMEGSVQEAVQQGNNLALDIKTTVDIVNETMYDVAEEILDYEEAIKYDRIDW